ncbi:hypothetical protein ACFY7Z_09715 [Streptomyces sp. NPDC012623]|uniref:hypothetical protein n=1 Tax=unclassified Streptomyces TaxID=2593676 RepID=UPI0036AB4FBE
MFAPIKKAVAVTALVLAFGGLTPAELAHAAGQPREAEKAVSARALPTEQFTCIRGTGVAYRDAPGGNRMGTAPDGNGFNITGSSGNWRKGNLWGGPEGVWVYMQYVGTCSR